MAVPGTSAPSGARGATTDGPGESLDGWAVAAIREENRWRCAALDRASLVDLDAVITELRLLRSTGAVVGLLAVDDEFFVLVRPIPGGVSLLLSDATAALDYDVAADVLDLLRIDVPDEDDADGDPWPEGDLAVLADLGLPADELEVLVEETDLYPDEMLAAIARRCGFADELAEVVATQ